MVQWAGATQWAKHAIGPQVKAQEAQDKAQELRPIHTPQEVQADIVVLEKEMGELLYETIWGDSQ